MVKKLLSGREKIPVYVLLLIFAIVCGFSVWNDSATYDEKAHISFGKEALAGKIEHASMQKMPITALNALPAIIQVIGISVQEQKMIWLCRLPTIIAAILLGIFIFIWSKKLYGPLGGYFSLFCYVFCPTIVAHSRLATTDLYCGLFIFVSIYAFRRYVEQTTLIRLLFLSIIVGIAQLTKQTCLLLFPIFFVLGVWEIFSRLKGRKFHFNKRILSHFLLSVVIIVLIINLGYSFRGSFQSLDDYRKWYNSEDPEVLSVFPPEQDKSILTGLSAIPIPLPAGFIEAFIIGQYYNRFGKGHGPVYILGDLSRFGHWYYFPVAFLLKTPLSTIVLMVVALWITLRSIRFSTPTDESALLVAAGTIFFFFSFFTTAQIGIRYLLPVFPLFYVLLGKVVASETMTPLKKYGITGLSIFLVISSLSYYPHYISYFNEICWDRTRLYKYLADSNLDWGQDALYLQKYLKLHSNEKNIHVNPERPTSGKIIVNVNSLVGITRKPSVYAWLRNNYEPAGRIAYSWLYYEIPDR
jgi:4-amino-4-deoxy-L-arabinose transferase-like glycosyltransferase